MQNKNNEWSNLTITNRFIFNKVFTSDREACGRMLEILLGFKIARIEPPQGEYTVEESIGNHAVRFDVYTEDESRIYDVEMQTEFQDDLPERSRYYQSMMDVDSLRAGQPYKDLKDSIVIFICTFDPFGDNNAKYIFKNVDILNEKINPKTKKRELQELGDRSEKVFFNVNEYDKIKNDEELQGLLKFFCNNKADTRFADRLTDLVEKAKKNLRWREEYMTYERWQYYERQDALREGAAHQKAEDEKLLLAERERSAQITAQKDEEIQRLRAELAQLKARR